MPTSLAISTRSGFTLQAELHPTDTGITLSLHAPPGPRCLLHWGLCRPRSTAWEAPPTPACPPHTQPAGPHAVQTPLRHPHPAEPCVFHLPSPTPYASLEFVLFFPDSNRWDNNAGQNYRLPLHAPTPPHPSLGPWEPLAHEIVHAETHHQSWTLMHRFNLCHDLLDRVQAEPTGLACLFVWLRFSALRQLTWQRRYNTKPRELAHAQDRLTQKLALLALHHPNARPLTRLLLGTLGRGGDGQRIRDEILHIMHRHHIKEVSGHFLEEWHQKLHNNTTPDDIVICEAYLEFLRSHGHQDRFYQALEAGGVTRQRLESFERPIRTAPDFVPHLRDALLHDFHHFLGILKACHAGTDLETAFQAARGHLDGDLQGRLQHLWEIRGADTSQLPHLARLLTEIRQRLAHLLPHSGSPRDLLYLDLALEQLLRTAVERNLQPSLHRDLLADLLARVLENYLLSQHDPELALVAQHWQRLLTLPRASSSWALHAKAVLDRLARALSHSIDQFYQTLQPIAEHLGHGFQAQPWTVSLFSEEVVRGQSLAFVLSTLLHHLEPQLRQAAQLGDWQIISRGQATGIVAVVHSLRSVQQRPFPTPTILIADQVAGDEDLPPGIAAVIAPNVVDLVSHVAVRARNARLLFAACHDRNRLQQLKNLQGRHLSLQVNPAGDVLISDASPDLSPPSNPPPTPIALSVTPAPTFAHYAIPDSEFHPRLVGAKSCHLTQIRPRLPAWIHIPRAAALPFGVLEHVLAHPCNQPHAARYETLHARADQGDLQALPELRATILDLAAPDDLLPALHQTLRRVGLPTPHEDPAVWQRIKQVWASKWNERAFLSRQRLGLPHRQLLMAVLIQPVIPADFAFVIHTTHPATNNPNELFAEVVLGLGETLVGNHPGRAFSFTWNKSTQQPTFLSFPSKSTGLYGQGLIFRSDSNGEDLAHFAGAGLYDSFLLTPPRSTPLDYTQSPLLWDEPFQGHLAGTIARLGLAVEHALGAPQDIEGALVHDQPTLLQTRPQVGLD